MNMQPQRFGIPSHQGLSDSYASSCSDPTYHSISSRANSLSVNIASYTNRSYSDVSFNVGSGRPSSSAGNYPTNGFWRNADMHSNSSGGYVTSEQVHQPPRQNRSFCKRWILIGCIVMIVLLIGGVTTTTTQLLIQSKERNRVFQGNESTSETTGLTSASNATTSTTKSVSTTTKLLSPSTVTTLPPTTPLETTTHNPLPPSPSTTRRLPTTTPPVTTCHPLPTTTAATTTATITTTTLSTTSKSTTPQTTSENPTTTTKTTITTSQKTESCTRKCHTCTSKSEPVLCPANGILTSNHHWHVSECPCNSTCYSEIRSTNDNAVHRGCTNDFPIWEELAKVNKTCQIDRTSLVCFCHGDRCNTEDMTVFPEYEN